MTARRTFLLGLAMVAGALVFDAGILYLPGVALAALAALAPLWSRLASLGVRLTRDPLPAQVVEGEPFEVTHRLRSGGLPLAGRVADPVVGDPRSVWVWLPRARRELRSTGRMPRRGRQTAAPASLALAAPLGLGARSVGSEAGQSVLVLPRIDSVRGPDGGEGPSAAALRAGGAELAATGALRPTPADPELDGVRPYQPGSPASRIYWPALARTGELVERRLVGGGGTAPLVALELPPGVEGEHLEMAVRAAASLCLHLARGVGCELLLPGSANPIEVTPSLEGWPSAHARLALAEAGSGRPSLRAVSTDRALFWVTPSPGTSPRPGYVVRPAIHAEGPAAFTVAGCAGVPVAGPRRARGRVAA